MIDIPFNSPDLYYAGRWVQYSDSAGSAWQGSQVRFSVQGSTLLRITAKVLDPGSGSLSLLVANVDGGDYQLRTLSSDSGSLTGDASADFTLPDTGKHTIVLKLFGMPSTQFNLSSYTRLKTITLNDGGTVIPWGGNAPYRLQMVGDSWMSAQNDWPYLLGADDFNIYPIAFGGAKIADLNSQYNFTSSGVTVNSEPPAHGIVIGSAVNDQFAGVSTADYKTSMLALVDKVRALHPESLIIIAGAPRNQAASKPYNQYDAVNAEVAAAKSNTVFIPVPNSVADSLSWDSDTAHLTYAGRVAYAAWWKTQLRTFFPALYKDKLQIQTPSGLKKISLVSATLSEATQNVMIRVPEGYYKLRSVPVSPPYPDGDMVLKTSTGSLRFIE